MKSNKQSAISGKSYVPFHSSDPDTIPLRTSPSPSLDSDVSLAAAELRVLTKGCVHTYMTDLVTRYLESATYDLDIFEGQLLTLGDILGRLQKVANEVLQDCGFGDEYREIDDRCKELREITVYIEDVLCIAIDTDTGPASVARFFSKNKFMFQKYLTPSKSI